jgi:hypothetical protein
MVSATQLFGILFNPITYVGIRLDPVNFYLMSIYIQDAHFRAFLLTSFSNLSLFQAYLLAYSLYSLVLAHLENVAEKKSRNLQNCSKGNEVIN